MLRTALLQPNDQLTVRLRRSLHENAIKLAALTLLQLRKTSALKVDTTGYKTQSHL
jgi:hypothetical protein